MSKEVRALEPKVLWNNFADLNAVPRGSKKEERVIQFMVNFGNKLNLETIVDPVGNVIIKKPATSGMENKKTVVLQSHLDMVHQKNADTVFDFDTEGIKMKIEGYWVKADKYRLEWQWAGISAKKLRLSFQKNNVMLIQCRFRIIPL